MRSGAERARLPRVCHCAGGFHRCHKQSGINGIDDDLTPDSRLELHRMPAQGRIAFRNSH